MKITPSLEEVIRSAVGTHQKTFAAREAAYPVSIALYPSTTKRIDAFRTANELGSRSRVIRMLVEIGLEVALQAPEVMLAPADQELDDKVKRKRNAIERQRQRLQKRTRAR